MTERPGAYRSCGRPVIHRGLCLLPDQQGRSRRSTLIFIVHMRQGVLFCKG